MVIYVLGLIGVVVFAFSGVLAAGRKQLDWIGAASLGFVTALGGGTVRDVLLNLDVVFWIREPVYFEVTLLSVIATVAYLRYLKPPVNALLYADALGMALFTMVGAQVAEMQGVPGSVIVLMGVLTGAAGGALRDIMIGEIPMVFRPTEPLYITAGLVGVLCYLGLQKLGLEQALASLVGIGVIAVTRISALVWNIRLPSVTVRTHLAP